MTVRYFSDRQKPRGRNAGAAPMTTLRIAEFSRFLTHKYGETLPNDDAGRDDAFVMANLLARTRGGDRSIPRWLALRAPWMTIAEITDITATAMRLQLKWTADKLARRIGLDFATRTRLRIKTIGSTDVDKEQRRAIRLQKDRDRKRERRRNRSKLRETMRRRTSRTEAVRNV
jgi:hypothetical protein